jgi:hypothetical protein
MRARISVALLWATLVACAGGTPTLSQASRDGSGSSGGGEGAKSSSSSSGGPSEGSSGSGSSSGGAESGDDGGTSPGNLTGDAGPGGPTGSNGCTVEATNFVDPSYMPNIGFDIVGAGVSTCAPTLAPQ